MTIAEDCIRLLRIMQKELLQSTGSLDKSKSNWEFMELLKATIKKQLDVQNIMIWSMTSIYLEVYKDYRGFICKETSISLREHLQQLLQLWLRNRMEKILLNGPRFVCKRLRLKHSLEHLNHQTKYWKNV